MAQAPSLITENLPQLFVSDLSSGGPKPDIRVNLERCQMKKAYEDVAKFIRWAVIGVIAFIFALPTLTSVGSSL